MSPECQGDFQAPQLPLDAAAFDKLARAKLSAAPSARQFDKGRALGYGRSDFDLNPTLQADMGPVGLIKPAAVLVGIVKRPSLTLLLTERSVHLSSHAGQIAFPGGRIDDTDAGPLAAALREAHEEIGLPSSAVEPLGFLDTYRTGTGYLIHPLVAFIDADAMATLKLAPAEVSDVFEVPHEFVLDPANHQRHTREFQGRTRAFFAIPWTTRYIWGATAGIIRNLAERLGEDM